MTDWAGSTLPLYWVIQPVRVKRAVWDGYQLVIEAVIWGWEVAEGDQHLDSRRRRHLPRPLKWWWPTRLDREYAQRVGLRSGDAPLFTKLGRGQDMGRDEWLVEIQRACAGHGIAPERIDRALRHPATTAYWAYRLAKLAAARLGVSSREVGLALAVLRLAATPLLKRRLCELCFRVAFPGLNRCRLHSRAKVVAREGSVQASRTARLVQQQQPPATRRAAMAQVRGVSRESIMAGVLFQFPRSDPQEWRLEVVDTLSRAPHAQRALISTYRTLSPVALLAELRACIDPDHWPVTDWDDTIELADAWLSIAEQVAPGGPPSGPRASTADRVAAIEDMLVAGHAIHDIAAKLSMSSSNVYQLIQRYGVTRGVRSLRPWSAPLTRKS